ncbi:MAG: hypothetical protein PHY02_06330 [Phycisphaerae bacterium]|nr:hypothetical protein [Phycisphaerae bacterium]
MAKTTTNLEEATKQLRAAEAAYELVVSGPTAKMNEEQKKKHFESCRTALQVKNQAWQLVEDIRLGRIKPPAIAGEPDKKQDSK